MEPWKVLVQQGALESMAPSTRRAYERAVEHYLEVARRGGGDGPFPPTEASTLWYLANLQAAGISVKMMRVRLAGSGICMQAEQLVGPG